MWACQSNNVDDSHGAAVFVCRLCMGLGRSRPSKLQPRRGVYTAASSSRCRHPPAASVPPGGEACTRQRHAPCRCPRLASRSRLSSRCAPRVCIRTRLCAGGKLGAALPCKGGRIHWTRTLTPWPNARCRCATQPAMFAAFVALVVVLTLGVVGVASSGALSHLKPLLWVALGAIAAAACFAVDRGSAGRGTSRVTIAPVAANSRPAVTLAPSAAPPTAAPASSQPAPSAASLSAPQLDASAFLVAGKPSAFDFHSRSDDLDWYPQDGVTESSWSDSDSDSDSGSDAGGDDVSEGGDDERARGSSKANGQESGGKAAEEKVRARHGALAVAHACMLARDVSTLVVCAAPLVSRGARRRPRSLVWTRCTSNATSSKWRRC